MMTKDNKYDIENTCKRLEENYDAELITNDALMVLIESLNEDHVKIQHESNNVIKSLKHSIVMKKEKMKEEVNTLRGLNYHLQ